MNSYLEYRLIEKEGGNMVNNNKKPDRLFKFLKQKIGLVLFPLLVKVVLANAAFIRVNETKFGNKPSNQITTFFSPQKETEEEKTQEKETKYNQAILKERRLKLKLELKKKKELLAKNVPSLSSSSNSSNFHSSMKQQKRVTPSRSLLESEFLSSFSPNQKKDAVEKNQKEEIVLKNQKFNFQLTLLKNNQVPYLDHQLIQFLLTTGVILPITSSLSRKTFRLTEQGLQKLMSLEGGFSNPFDLFTTIREGAKIIDFFIRGRKKPQTKEKEKGKEKEKDWRMQIFEEMMKDKITGSEKEPESETSEEKSTARQKILPTQSPKAIIAGLVFFELHQIYRRRLEAERQVKVNERLRLLQEMKIRNKTRKPWVEAESEDLPEIPPIPAVNLFGVFKGNSKGKMIPEEQELELKPIVQPKNTILESILNRLEQILWYFVRHPGQCAIFLFLLYKRDVIHSLLTSGDSRSQFTASAFAAINSNRDAIIDAYKSASAAAKDFQQQFISYLQTTNLRDQTTLSAANELNSILRKENMKCVDEKHQKEIENIKVKSVVQQCNTAYQELTHDYSTLGKKCIDKFNNNPNSTDVVVSSNKGKGMNDFTAPIQVELDRIEKTRKSFSSEMEVEKTKGKKFDLLDFLGKEFALILHEESVVDWKYTGHFDG